MRHPAVPPGTFKPKPTAIETRQDATTKVVREIIENEAAARNRKTERLRLARLAREATEAGEPSSTLKQAVKRKKA